MTRSNVTRLTPNFTLQEFLGSGASELPTGEELRNLYCLASRLQAIRDILGKPIIITSGYRSPEHNKQVGGAQNSYHKRGMAADIHIPGMTPHEVHQFLTNWSGGLGAYSTHTHVDIRPRKTRWSGK